MAISLSIAICTAVISCKCLSTATSAALAESVEIRQVYAGQTLMSYIQTLRLRGNWRGVRGGKVSKKYSGQ